MTTVSISEKSVKTPFHSILLIVTGILIVGLITAVYLNAGYLADWIWDATGIDYEIITILQTAMLIVNLVTIPFCGILTLKISDFKLFCLGFILCVAGFLGMFVFPSLAGLIIFYVILFGFGSAISGYSIAMSVILPLIGENFAGIAAAGLISCGNIISLVLFPVLQVFALSASGNLVFLIFGGIGICFMPLIYYIFRRRKTVGITSVSAAKTEGVKLRSLAKEVFTNPKFYLLCFFSFSFGLLVTAPSGNLMHSLEVYYSLDSVTSSLYLSLFSLIFAVSGIVCGIFVTRIRNKIMYAGICFVIVGIIYILNIFDISMTMALIILYISAFLLGAISPSIALITREWVGAAKFAAVYSPIYLLLRFGGIVVIFVGGMEYALLYNLNGAFVTMAVLAQIAGILGIIFGIMENRKFRKIHKTE